MSLNIDAYTPFFVDSFYKPKFSHETENHIKNYMNGRERRNGGHLGVTRIRTSHGEGLHNLYPLSYFIMTVKSWRFFRQSVSHVEER